MPTIDDFKNAYLGMKTDTTALEALGVLSDLEKEKFALQLERIAKEKDPQAEAEARYKFYGQIKQDLGFYIGRDVKGLGATLGSVAGMERGDKFQAYVSAGVKALEDAL